MVAPFLLFILTLFSFYVKYFKKILHIFSDFLHIIISKGRCKICQTTKTLITKTTLITTQTITLATSQAMQTIAELQTAHPIKQTTNPITNQTTRQVIPHPSLPVQEKTALAVLTK